MSSPAIAPALPTTDRRVFLATLAAAGVMTGAPIALAADDGDEALLALGAEMEVQREALRTCGALTDGAYARLSDEPDYHAPVCRVIDGDSCVWPTAKTLKESGEFGGIKFRIWDDAEMFRSYLRDTEALATPLAYFRTRAAEIVAAIEARDATIKQAEDAAGVTAANTDEKHAREALDDTLVRIAETPAKTIPGLLIKARAAAYDMCDPHDDTVDYLKYARARVARAREEHLQGTTRLQVLPASLYADVLLLAFPRAQVTG